MKKKIFSLILFIVLCLLLMPMSASADSGSITEVDITVPPLTGGKTVASAKPILTAKAGEDTAESVVFFSADWEEKKGSSWVPLADTDAFKAGYIYRLSDPMLYLISGYTFDSGVTVKVNGKEVTPTVSADLLYFDLQTFTAACTVSFGMNGRGTAPAAQYDADGRLLEPTAPADDVYAFAGWYSDADLTRSVTFPLKLTSDITLYAAWKPRVKAVDITVKQAKYTPSGEMLGASYTVDGSTDSTTSDFAQYTSPNGTSWVQIRSDSSIYYGTQNKIEFTVSLTNSDVRMIDEATDVTVHGAEGAACDIQRTADSVKVTVLYVLPSQKFTVKFDTDGHAPAIPDQEVDARSTLTMPDMSAYTDGEWRFDYWYWGGDPEKDWRDWYQVWDDITLTAKWVHCGVKVTFVMSCTGEEIVCWDENGSSLNYSLDELYAHDEYYIYNLYFDKEMNQNYAGEKIYSDVTMYVYAMIPIREVDFTLQEPSVGKTMTPDVQVTFADPENSVKVERLGKWYVSEDGNTWRAMETDEKFADGHFYRYSGLKFGRTENKYYFDNRYRDIVLKRNGNECSWNNNTDTGGYVEKVSYVLTGMVEFELNGHGKFIRSQDVQPGQKAARPDDPTASGWKFTGWYTDKDCTTLYDFDTPVNSNLLLYAGWEARIDQVDADFVLPWLHCKAGSDILSLTPNHKEAYLSASRILWKKNDGTGWKVMNAGEEFLPGTEYRAEFTVIADSKIPFGGNVTITVRGSGTGAACSLDASGNLKVVYTKRPEYTTHEVTFNTEGKGAPLNAQTVEEGLTAARPADPACEGYVFDGWYTDPAHTKRFDFENPVVEDMTLYAHWTRSIRRVTVTFPALIVGKTPPENVSLSTEYGKEGLWFYETEAEWEKDNTRPLDYWHIFGRLQADQNYTVRHVAIPVAGNDWFFAEDLEIVSSAGTVEVLSVNGHYAEVNIHITVKNSGIFNPTPGVPSVLTVTFDTRGHGTVESQSVALDGSAVMPQAPAAAGYIFTGWYIDEACTALYDFDTPVTSDIILYAGWKKAPDNPQTGDSSNLFLWITLLFVSGTALGRTAFRSRQKKQN